MAFLVAGLGNPGRRYQGTRHNAGFRVIEKLAGKHGVTFTVQGEHYLYAEGEIEGQKAVLIQPFTYMNRSGKAVARALKKFNIAQENLIVAYDDMDLGLGVVKIKPKGSSGGHRGINSIIHSLQSSYFTRVRVGIGKAPPWIDGPVYVLGRPDGEEREVLEESEKKAADAISEIIKSGVDTAMNKVNRSQG